SRAEGEPVVSRDPPAQPGALQESPGADRRRRGPQEGAPGHEKLLRDGASRDRPPGAGASPVDRTGSRPGGGAQAAGTGTRRPAGCHERAPRRHAVRGRALHAAGTESRLMSPEAPKAKSFADILQQNQEFIAHLQTLQDDMGAQLTENAKELELVKRQLEAKQQELDELQNAQLQWAMDRQALLEQHESLKKGHQNLQQNHDRSQVELGRLKDELARGKTPEHARAGERRAL